MPCLLALTLAAAQAAAVPSPAAAAPTPTPAFVTVDRISAVVGDDVILESEVDRLVAIQLVSPRGGETPNAYRERVLTVRIDEVLQEQQLRRTGGVEPDPREVESRLASLEQGLKASRGESLDVALARAGVTRDEVKGWIRRGLALETYVRERIAPTVKITDADLQAYYEGPFREEAAASGLTKLPPFPEVQDRVRELVRERKIDEEIARWMADLREKTRIVVYRRTG